MLVFLVALLVPELKAQYVISGSVSDTVNLSATQYTSISLIRASDSILQTVTRADEQGRFRLTTDTAGKYLILIAHPSFLTYIDPVEVQQAQTSLGNIALVSRKQLLQEVVITDARAIVIKGDTIEYAADSFKTRAFDNVDELLKKLPGLEIGRNGKIKAYGEEVKKMLVDGEEFFSDDPAIVAQTLRASTVEKVQVFDKKSDQAAFTGIDDGERIKTINLKLKDDAKRGYFGKVTAGAGPPEYWENQAMINAFKGKRKIAAYGIMSNTNSSLDWDDQRKYSGEGEITYDEESGGYFSMSEGTGFNGEGLPKNWTGGVLYNNKWMGDSLSFSGSYKYGKVLAEANNNSITRYILPDTQYINTLNAAQTTISQKHNISTTTEYKIDTSSSLKLKLDGTFSTHRLGSRNTSSAATPEGVLINDNERLQQSDSENKLLAASLFYRKRFKKKGRSFSVSLKGNYSDVEGTSLLKSNYNLYSIDSAYSLDQRKINNSRTLTGNLRLTYSEPLSKVAFLELNYGVNINNNNADNQTMDRNSNGGGSDVINPAFSSHYIFNVMDNQGGASLKFNFKKVNFSFGGNMASTNFRQKDLMYDTSYNYNYLNFFPRLSFSYNKSQQTSVRLDYSGRTQQPSMEQLQPLRNNTDPLNIAIGNPDLKQAFNHTINVRYNSYKVMSGSNIYLNGGISLVQNAISQQQQVDISGRRTYRYVNVDGNFNSWFWGYYGFKKILGIRPDLGASMNFNRTHNFINGLANRNDNTRYSPNISLSYDKDTTFNIRYSFSPEYNHNTSSIRQDIKTKYWIFEQTLDGSVGLPLGIRAGTSITWNIRQRLDPAERNNNVFRWNAYISRAFLKDRSLEAKLYANDILDQNQGYNRVTNAEYIAENTYNTIRRYFLFSLTWNFTKTGGASKPSDDLIIPE